MSIMEVALADKDLISLAEAAEAAQTPVSE